MSRHNLHAARAGLLPLVILLLLTTVVVGWAQAQSQDGLPVELVIKDTPPYDEQLQTMRSLYEFAKATMPKAGILDGLKSMFSGGEKPNYATVADLVENHARLRGSLVEAEGMYEAGEAGGVLRSLGAEIHVELVGGMTPEGFGTTGPDGMPVDVTGRIESNGSEALLRAETMTPSALISGVRTGRILELQKDWAAAADAYQDVAGNRALSSRPLAPFARIRAGEIAEDNLTNDADHLKRARSLFAAAWQPYSVERQGKPVYYTWKLADDDGWREMSVTEALKEPLNRLNAETTGYKIVDMFVRIAGNSPAVGVLLMAIVVRLAIFPLTRKQLDSQRRMQAIQPQIKEMQQKYATDKQKFQEEFWKLCQANDCNPLGGCLPMLVQMPILYFLYQGIRAYIVQFSGTHFLWVANLAQPDLILLVLYTISMVAFQKMTAATQPTADPQQAQQQKMMAYMMPVMFFFFFQGFPAAFILYWLGTNVIYFAEQFLFLRRQAAVSTEPAQGKVKGGFMSAMMEAAARRRGEEPVEEERAPSFEEKRKQDKQGRRRRG